MTVVLDETKDAQEFVSAWRQLEECKRSFDWTQPSIKELAAISLADSIVFRRTEIRARIIELRPGWRGAVSMAAVLAIMPVVVSLMVGIVMALRGRPALGAALTAFLVVYPAAAIHEFGHWLGMIGWGRPVAMYGVMPFSSVRLRFEVCRDATSPARLAWMYAGGITANLALALVALAGAVLLDVRWLWLTVLANAILVVVNSLPLTIWSSDGTTLLRMLKHLRSAGKPHKEASRMIDIPGTYKPRRTLRPWTKTEDGVVVYMLGPTVRAVESDGIRCCRLNRSCGEIWEMCDGDNTVDDLVDIIASRYDADKLEVRDAVREALLVLSEQECVVLNHEPFF